MAYIFFESILRELGHKLTYDAVVNYAGNSFCEKSWDMIAEHNPFHVNEVSSGGNTKAMNTLAGLINGANIKVKKT